MMNQNSFLPPQINRDPPIINFGGGSGMMPPPTPFPLSIPPQMSFPSAMPFQPQMSFPNSNMMSAMGPPMYDDPGFSSFPRRRAMRICRPHRRRRRSRRCRPVVHVIESSSCSSLSSYSTRSSCSRHRHRSRSRSRRVAPSQPQQPIILLPIQSQTAPPAIAAAPVQPQIQQQPQQIILPPIQVQQPGQLQQSQQLALPMQQFGGQIQQQPYTLAPIQLSGSNLIGGANSNGIIASGQPMLQPSLSFPQITNFGQPQQIQGGAIQYVQAARHSSPSPLQYVSSDRRSVLASQRTLVNSPNKRQSTRVKPVARSTSTRDFPQSDLKHGRRPFDWYGDDRKKKIFNENTRLGKRGGTYVD